MLIQRVVIRNYRSISDLTLELSPRINVFIGANNVGKSNILSAIEWVTGSSYPTQNRLQRNDFYLGNEDSPLDIEITFDDGNTLAFNTLWWDYGNREKHGLNLNKNYISDTDRSKYVTASIGPDRKILDNPAANQWSLLGRMLKDFNDRLYIETMEDSSGFIADKASVFKQRMEIIRDEILFSIQDEQGVPLMTELSSILQEETARQLNCSPNDLTIDLNIYDPWNLFRTLQIFITERGNGIQMRASEMGMGVQASLTIAILRAYSKLKLNNRTPIIIDEPELYLHPQARRQFYKVMEELADSGTQIFLTTHSTEFIDLGHFDQIFLVRKNPEEGTYVRAAKPERFVTDLSRRISVETSSEDLMAVYKNAFENTGDSRMAAEALFASKVILVEGESESLILPFCFDMIGYDYIGKGISIVRCGGKNEIDRFYRLYSEFGIPCYILFDGDSQNAGTKDEAHTIAANKAILALFGESSDYPDGYVHDNYLGFTKRLEDALNIGEVGSSTKGLKLFTRFKEEVSRGVSVPKWVILISKRIDQLPEEAPSVLLKEEFEGFDETPFWIE